jgi:predicted MFS family arabinose efflux permease
MMAAFSLAFLVALPLGGILTDMDINYCFGASAACDVLGGLLTLWLLEESNTNDAATDNNTNGIIDSRNIAVSKSVWTLLREADPLPGIR